MVDVSRVDQVRTHRLIPSNHEGSILADLFDDDDEATAIFDLDGATNERMLAEADLMPGINRSELVFRVPYSSIINASFCHARVGGGRFNTSERGAWYAGFKLETSLAEVVWHHTRWLDEIGELHDNITRDDWLADFHGDFQDLRTGENEFEEALNPNPEVGYPAGQTLATKLLESDSPGIVYPSVRDQKGTNIVCFRPALVDNLQRGKIIRLIWAGSHAPDIKEEN